MQSRVIWAMLSLIGLVPLPCLLAAVAAIPGRATGYPGDLDRTVTLAHVALWSLREGLRPASTAVAFVAVVLLLVTAWDANPAHSWTRGRIGALAASMFGAAVTCLGGLGCFAASIIILPSALRYVSRSGACLQGESFSPAILGISQAIALLAATATFAAVGGTTISRWWLPTDAPTRFERQDLQSRFRRVSGTLAAIAMLATVFRYARLMTSELAWLFMVRLQNPNANLLGGAWRGATAPIVEFDLYVWAGVIGLTVSLVVYAISVVRTRQTEEATFE